MKKYAPHLLIAVILAAFITACSGSSSGGIDRVSSAGASVEVAFHDIPYPTDQYLRIGYTLKTWEYEKDGLELYKIQVLNGATGEQLLVVERPDLPQIYKNPLDFGPLFVMDTLTNYYLSLQLPIPLNQAPPQRVTHRLIFRNPASGSYSYLDGGSFSPRLGESPLSIASPVKGENIVFQNLSTSGCPHFSLLMFMNGDIYRNERFAVDTMEVKGDLSTVYRGDPRFNSSYYHYGRTLHAVADGTVVRIVDGFRENNGNQEGVVFRTADEYAGNYLVLDIGGGRYAFYVHCIPGSFRVAVGDRVAEGDALALLGNSGNSTGPHLHFHIADSSDLWTSKGVPFVLKRYTRKGTFNFPDPGTLTPLVTFTNALMEAHEVINVE